MNSRSSNQYVEPTTHIGAAVADAMDDPGTDTEVRDLITRAEAGIRSITEQRRARYASILEQSRTLRHSLGETPHPALAAEQLALEALTGEAGRAQIDLARLELLTRHLDEAEAFTRRESMSSSLNGGPGGSSSGIEMRIIEAQERERARLAQEVHDGPAQGLANAIFQADYVERLFERDHSAAVGELRLLRDGLRRELVDLRSFIGQLRPPLLDELGLNGALEELAQGVAKLAGIPILVDFGAPGDRLEPATATVVYRVAQEALHNVRKHASANVVHLTTRLELQHWILEVRDDGRGFDQGESAERGRRSYGVQFMNERAELIGASLEVLSHRGAGTVVRLSVPFVEKG